MIKNYIEDIIQDLTLCRAVSSFRVLKLEVGDEYAYVRVKCGLSSGDLLEFAEYIVIRKGKIKTETYSFHWQSADSRLRKRWDNVHHHKTISTFPNHLHLPGQVVASKPMTLKMILADIEESLDPNARDQNYRNE